MKALLSLGLVVLSLSGVTHATEIQSLSGDEAYQMYLKLPGVACQEYRITNYVVYSKYQTQTCRETQSDNSQWTCTVQLALKNGKTTAIMSADCTREI